MTPTLRHRETREGYENTHGPFCGSLPVETTRDHNGPPLSERVGGTSDRKSVSGLPGPLDPVTGTPSSQVPTGPVVGNPRTQCRGTTPSRPLGPDSTVGVTDTSLWTPLLSPTNRRVLRVLSSSSLEGRLTPSCVSSVPATSARTGTRSTPLEDGRVIDYTLRLVPGENFDNYRGVWSGYVFRGFWEWFRLKGGGR